MSDAYSLGCLRWPVLFMCASSNQACRCLSDLSPLSDTVAMHVPLVNICLFHDMIASIALATGSPLVDCVAFVLLSLLYRSVTLRSHIDSVQRFVAAMVHSRH